MDFRQAERRFEHLRTLRQRGELDEDQYLVEVAKLLLRDDEGAFWMLDAETGTWFRNQGEGWREADPGAEAAAGIEAGAGRIPGRWRSGRARRQRLLAAGLLLILLAAAAVLVFLRGPLHLDQGVGESTPMPPAEVEVTIASPPDGGTVALGQEVGIEAMLQAGSDTGAAARVVLQVDGETLQGQAVGTAMQPGQPALPLSFPWRPKTVGEHQVSVLVLDAGGQPLGQATIHLQVAEQAGEHLPEPDCTPDAAFLADVTIPPGAEFAPGAPMEKVWQVRNSGTCAWGVDYELVRVAGDGLDAAEQVPVPPTAAGDLANLEVTLTAPETPGTYASSWQMRDPRHVFFGPVLTCSVKVQPLVETGLPPAAPVELQAQVSEDDEAVYLTWEDRSDDEDAFRIYREDVEASIGLVPADSQRFVDRTATCGHTYRYQVVAFNAAGSSAPAASPPVILPPCAVRDEAPTLELTVVPTEVVASSAFIIVVKAVDDVAVSQVVIRGEGTGDPELDAGRAFACADTPCTVRWPLTWRGEVSATLTLVAVARDSAGQESEPAQVEVRIRLVR